MEQQSYMSCEKNQKGFSYFEKHPTTEQICKRRKLSEYSQNNCPSLYSSIDEYTYSAQNSSSRSSSSNNNNNTASKRINTNLRNMKSDYKSAACNSFSLHKSNQDYPDNIQNLSSSSFQPLNQLKGVSKAQFSLKDFLNSSALQQSSSQQQPAKSIYQGDENRNKSTTNNNLFDGNNYSFQQLLKQTNKQSAQIENQIDRKSFDSIIQNSFQNLTISNNNNNNNNNDNQDNNKDISCDFIQRESMIKIPKAIKSQTPQYFTSPCQQQKSQMIITTSSLNNIMMRKNNEQLQISSIFDQKDKQIKKSQNKQNKDINDDKRDQFYMSSISQMHEESIEDIDDENFNRLKSDSLQQQMNNSISQQKVKPEQNVFLQRSKEFQQSANRGRQQLGDRCPLSALKKQFPIIFPVGIPIMGQLNKLLNLDGQDYYNNIDDDHDEDNNNTSIIKQNRSNLNKNTYFQDEQFFNQKKQKQQQLQWEIMKEHQQQQSDYELAMMEQEIDPLVGNLTRNQRKEKVERYLEKKRNRKWKNIRYNIRKNLADQRERVQGRFVKQKNSRFNFDLLDAQYLKQLTKESDKMRLIDISHNTDNSFDIQNHSFES